MKRTLAAAAVLATALPLALGNPASAKPLFVDRFTDVIDETPYDCDGTPAFDSGTVDVNLMANLRGSSEFPYFRESVHGTGVTTNLDTGGTYTNVFDATTTDHKIIDNGDGTITIISQGAGGSRFYDQNGKLVLKDPGMLRTSVVVDYNGTPSNPDDDIVFEDTFQIIKPSTGHSDLSDRNFCEDLRTFTS